jgi:NADH oxidase (H2O-forming)
MEDTKILSITNDVTWIGVLDPDIRTFDVVMETKYGTTYNSYFINAQKKTIIDPTKEKFWEPWLAKIKQVTDPSEIEYIIVSHAEPDHSGNLKNLLKLAPKAKVVGSGNALRYMAELMNMDFQQLVMKDGDVLELGNKKLRFISAPNLHWPDTCFNYLEEDKILFSCDIFGAHFCNAEMYDDKVGNYDDAFKYYFDVIMKPFSRFMRKAIEKIRPLEIKAICTGHGPLLMHDWKKYVDLAEEYSKEAMKFPANQRVFIAYVSAYGNTGMIAKAIAEGIKRVSGVEADLCDIEKMNAAEIIDRLTKATALIIGSPTINQNILPPVYTLFALCSPLRDKGKLAACFGSYGWSGEGMKQMESALISLKFDFFPGGIFSKFTPNEQDLKNCMEWGESFGKKMLEKNLCN